MPWTYPARGPALLAVLAVLFAALGLCACSDVKVLEHNSKAIETSPQGFKPLDGPYVLGVGDEMTISVWPDQGLERSVRVDPSGSIDYPLVGQVKVFGLTVNELRDQLRVDLAKYLVDPKVDIDLNAFNSLNVYVLGEVRTPGAVSPQRYVSAPEAIAAAGGFTEDARNDFVLLLRRDPKENALMGIAVNISLQAKGQPAVMLKGGDILYVPQSAIANVEDFMKRVTAMVNPLVNVGRGIIMVPDVSNVFNGQAFQNDNTVVRSGTANSAQAIVPAQ